MQDLEATFHQTIFGIRRLPGSVPDRVSFCAREVVTHFSGFDRVDISGVTQWPRLECLDRGYVIDHAAPGGVHHPGFHQLQKQTYRYTYRRSDKRYCIGVAEDLFERYFFARKR